MHPKPWLLVLRDLLSRGGESWSNMALKVARCVIPPKPELGEPRLDFPAASVEHRPADVVPQPLVVEYELANGLAELPTLPPALESPCALALSLWRGSTRGFDRIGGRTEFVGGDVCHGRGLAGSERGVARCPTQISGCSVCMAGRRASLRHGCLAARPGPEFDRATRTVVARARPLEVVHRMLRACGRRQGEKVVIRIRESSTAADRHETKVAVFREDHFQHSIGA